MLTNSERLPDGVGTISSRFHTYSYLHSTIYSESIPGKIASQEGYMCVCVCVCILSSIIYTVFAILPLFVYVYIRTKVKICKF